MLTTKTIGKKEDQYAERRHHHSTEDENIDVVVCNKCQAVKPSNMERLVWYEERATDTDLCWNCQNDVEKTFTGRAIVRYCTQNIYGTAKHINRTTRIHNARIEEFEKFVSGYEFPETQYGIDPECALKNLIIKAEVAMPMLRSDGNE